MEIIGLTNEQIVNVHLVLSSILQIGNVTFVTTGGTQVNDRSGKAILIIFEHLCN